MNAELDATDRDLIEHAKEALRRLYIEGRHEVAAALRTASGQVFTGIHIEADVGFADICGEVAAICHAVAHGCRDLDTIVALTGTGSGEVQLMAPCGRCREVISDFNKSAWVIVGTVDRPYKMRIAELLPLKA
ncbi:MAG: cytidine deaminase [Acidobacteriia bacterium]|nr:cytidine deaminase [Terriglobia bacterium]